MENSQNEVAQGYQNWLKNKDAIEANETAIAELNKKLKALKDVEKDNQKLHDAGILNENEYSEAAKNTAKSIEEVKNKLKELREEKKKIKGEDGLVKENSYQNYITETEELRIIVEQRRKCTKSEPKVLRLWTLAKDFVYIFKVDRL